MPAQNHRRPRRGVARPHRPRHRSNLVLAAVLVAVALSFRPGATTAVAAEVDPGPTAGPLPSTPVQPGAGPTETVPPAGLAAGIAAADGRMALAAARIEQAQRQRSIVEVDVARLTTAIAAADHRIAELRDEVAEQAVSLYVSPRTDPLEVYGTAGDLDAGVRRQGLVRSVVRDSTRAIDELHRVRQDLLALHGELQLSRSQLAAADGEAAAAALDLQRDRAVRFELAATLAQRVAALDRDMSGLEAGEGELLRIITAAQLADESGAAAGELGPAAAGSVDAAETAEVADDADVDSFLSPVTGPITSEFGPRWGRPHNGVDLDADVGTPVHSASRGVVVHADWMSGYGLTVVVDHGGGLTTVYAHLSDLGVGAGASVDGGELIGHSGATGNVTGPHLHFETREHGEPVDPRSYLS